MAHRVPQRGKKGGRGGSEVDRDKKDAPRHHAEKEAQFIALQGLPPLPAQHQEVKGKVDGEQEHKNGNDDLNGRLP